MSYGPAFDVGRTSDVNDPLGRVILSAATLATNNDNFKVRFIFFLLRVSVVDIDLRPDFVRLPSVQDSCDHMIDCPPAQRLGQG